MTTQLTVQELAITFDALPLERLNKGLVALMIFETGTDDWICEYQGEVEDAGEDFEEDDTYWKAYDKFCDALWPQAIAETGADEDDYGLLMTALCDDWRGVAARMQNVENREAFLGVIGRL